MGHDAWSKGERERGREGEGSRLKDPGAHWERTPRGGWEGDQDGVRDMEGFEGL